MTVHPGFGLHIFFRFPPSATFYYVSSPTIPSGLGLPTCGFNRPTWSDSGLAGRMPNNTDSQLMGTRRY